MNNGYTGSLFSPIDWASSGAEDELKKRQNLNAQIDWMNQMSQANQGNKLIQSALLDQYMGLMPKAVDHDNELNKAMNILQLGSTLGDDNIKNAGMSMIKSNPLMAQYFQTDASTTNPVDAKTSLLKSGSAGGTIQDLINNADSYDIGTRKKLFEDFINKTPENSQERNSLTKVSDYYTNANNLNDWGGSFAPDLGARLADLFSGGQKKYSDSLNKLNLERRKNKASEYRPYLSAYGVNI